MSGLRLLPWVQGVRREAEERGYHGTADGYLACGPCLAMSPPEARQEWNCGYERRLPNHIIARVDGRKPPAKGEQVQFAPKQGHLHLFSTETGERLAT